MDKYELARTLAEDFEEMYGQPRFGLDEGIRSLYLSVADSLHALATGTDDYWDGEAFVCFKFFEDYESDMAAQWLEAWGKEIGQMGTAIHVTGERLKDALKEKKGET